MSVFATRIRHANQLIDNEYADTFDYIPMREVVNAPPEQDMSRAAGTARAILLQPGMTLGSGWSLAAMHERASSEPTLFYMARGRLIDVRRFDRFILRSSPHNPEGVGTKNYEVGDAPKPVGFGRFLALLVELSEPIVSHHGTAEILDEERIPF